MFKNIPKLLFVIFIFALLLRTIKLDTFPVGFHSDEVKAGWNAYSILTTGLDDRLQKISLYYNSFGDYRPTGIFFFIIPSILIFGLNEFAVRFPSALFGALTIFPLYFLVLEIQKRFKKENLHKSIALITCTLLALSPWNIEVSRATSEVAISTFFALFSLYFLIKLISTNRLKYFCLVCTSILISYFLYHSIRLLAPLFFITIIVYYYRQARTIGSQKLVFISFIFVLLLTSIFSITSEGKQRFNQVSIFNDKDTTYEINRLKNENGNRLKLTNTIDSNYVVYAKRFALEYSKYFNGSFLVGNDAKPFRYTTPGAGLLTFIEYGLFIFGLYIVIKQKNLLILFLLLISPLPAALTSEDAPNLHRAFFMNPFILSIEAIGILKLLELGKNYKRFILLILFILITLNFLYFLYMYFNHSSLHKPFIKDYQLDASSYRNYGSKELAIQLEKIKGNYEKIVITGFPDNLYPWFAFNNHKNPLEFNQNKKELTDQSFQYANLIFTHTACPSDYAFENNKETKLLVIDSGINNCFYQTKIERGLKAKVVDKILLPDDSDAFIFLERNLK